MDLFDSTHLERRLLQGVKAKEDAFWRLQPLVIWLSEHLGNKAAEPRKILQTSSAVSTYPPNDGAHTCHRHLRLLHQVNSHL